MFYNPNIFLTLILGIILFEIGYRMNFEKQKSWLKIVLFLIALIFVIPCLSFVLYYTHIFDEPLWYIEYRSINYIEVLSGLAGLLLGFIARSFPKIGKFRIPHISFLAVSLFIIAIPFLKPILLPVELLSDIHNEWVDDVCLQTSYSTCGPCSVATILRYYGEHVTEEEIARHAYTGATSTEIWYLIRYLRNKGFAVKLHTTQNVYEVPTPAIIGTRVGFAGHFVALLEVTEETVTIGDSLIGKLVLTRNEFNENYSYEHFAVEIVKKK